MTFNLVRRCTCDLPCGIHGSAAYWSEQAVAMERERDEAREGLAASQRQAKMEWERAEAFSARLGEAVALLTKAGGALRHDHPLRHGKSKHRDPCLICDLLMPRLAAFLAAAEETKHE